MSREYEYSFSSIPVICIPQNDVIEEHGEFSLLKIAELLKKYKNSPQVIEFVSNHLI